VLPKAPDERSEAIDEVDVGERLGEREELELLRERMRALPARQREVMDLRVNHGLSHGEIAALLSISEESSRASYYQALRRLRAAFHVETERT
jgi:RNA polymerase sigma-70 factor (ECF subfamily)